MAQSAFNGKRIELANIDAYLQEQIGTTYVTERRGTIPMNDPLVQINFGEKYDGDCTLTTLTEIWSYYTGIAPRVIYDEIRAFAESKRFYTKNGTAPIFVNAINKHMSDKRKRGSRYFKNIGFNFQTICDKINEGTPVVLNITDDGRGFYKRHTVTVVGYHVFANIYTGKIIPFLLVHDNWKADVSYLDFEKLSVLSSINYMI